MSDRSLPEDLDQWPSDPYALLGVNYNSDRRTLRRAYAKLIRVYKPEHYPEHFRRIRDAYELLDQRLSWSESNGSDEMEVAPLADDSADAEAEVIDRPSSEPVEPEEPGKPADAEQTSYAMPDPVRFAPHDRDDLRQEALHGDFLASYAHGSQIALQGRGEEELFVRLFWMLRLDPSVDPARDPRDWLVAGIKRHGLRGRLAELYRCELIDDPAEALRGRCDEVIRCGGHLGLLTELVIARWAAAVKLQESAVVVRDLKALRGRLQDNSDVWGRLLLAAIDQLAWVTRDGQYQTLMACREEIEQVAEHSQSIAAELNQRDTLIDLVKARDQLKSLSNLPSPWRKSLGELLAISWNQPIEDFRHLLIEVLAPLVRNPIVGLEWLDKLAARCGPAMHRLGGLITTLANERGVGSEVPPHDLLLDRLIAFLIAAAKGKRSARWQRWSPATQSSDRSGRIELLMFCLQESVTMRLLTDVLAGSGRHDLAQFLKPAANAPLHLICMGYLAFWA